MGNTCKPMAVLFQCMTKFTTNKKKKKEIKKQLAEKIVVKIETKDRMCFPHTFLHSPIGKESTCNVGDPSWIPGSGRSAGEGIGYPLHYSWPSLMAELVKNPPAMQEIWVLSLDWEDLLEKGKATHSSSLAWVTKSQI